MQLNLKEEVSHWKKIMLNSQILLLIALNIQCNMEQVDDFRHHSWKQIPLILKKWKPIINNETITVCQLHKFVTEVNIQDLLSNILVIVTALSFPSRKLRLNFNKCGVFSTVGHNLFNVLFDNIIHQITLWLTNGLKVYSVASSTHYNYTKPQNWTLTFKQHLSYLWHTPVFEVSASLNYNLTVRKY